MSPLSIDFPSRHCCNVANVDVGKEWNTITIQGDYNNLIYRFVSGKISRNLSWSFNLHKRFSINFNIIWSFNVWYWMAIQFSIRNIVAQGLHRTYVFHSDYLLQIYFYLSICLRRKVFLFWLGRAYSQELQTFIYGSVTKRGPQLSYRDFTHQLVNQS